MTNNHIHHADSIGYQPFLTVSILIVLLMYILASILSNQHYKNWPLHRTFFWILGIFCVAAAVVGPLADRAHAEFTVHMIGHLLLGMLAPLLIVLSAPMTLVLRTLPVKLARRLSYVLKSSPVRFISDPIFASLLNFGGLWILYTTDLYATMQQNIWLHIAIHIHVFMAGYLFTISMIYIDVTFHRSSFVYRSIVLVIAIASHSILSKYIYANPPLGVPVSQAESGGMLMYYGGDAVDMLLIFILCFQWYRATSPKVFPSRPSTSLKM